MNKSEFVAPNIKIPLRKVLLVTQRRVVESMCPVAEKIQPQMLQFKTNYFDTSETEAQAEILQRTIRWFD